MLSCITALLFGIWFLLAFLLFSPPGNRLRGPADKSHNVLLFSLALNKFQCEAKSIIMLTAIASAALSFFTGNAFILVVGLVAGCYLPRFLIEKKRQYRRLNLLFKLTDPLRMLISRLPDQQNVTKAIEATRNEITEASIRLLFDDYIHDIAVGSSVKDSLSNMKRKVELRKFDIFIENLIHAHYDGFTTAAINALDKSVEAIELDLCEIEKVKEQSRNKKRKLYLALGTVWLFPPILSMISSGNTNIFINTLQGKILILLYFTGTIYVCVKGEEYLSLNLDEL